VSVPDDALPGPAIVRVELRSPTGKKAALTLLPVRIAPAEAH